jgi:3-deoxy-D-manno-octulosonic acid kinase
MKIPRSFKQVRRGSITAIVREDFAARFESIGPARQPPCAEETTLAGRATVRTLRDVLLDGSGVVIRESRRGGLLGRIIPDIFMGRCRPFRELFVAERARHLGIPTAEVLAAVREAVVGPLYRGALYTKEITDAVDLLSYLDSIAGRCDAKTLRTKRATVSDAGRMVRATHDAGLLHADLQLKNILVRHVDGPAVFLIDLDKARWYNRLPDVLRMTNLLRLARSATKAARSTACISRTDMLRFLKGYVGSDGAGRLRLYWRAPMLKQVYRLKWALSDALYRLVGPGS